MFPACRRALLRSRAPWKVLEPCLRSQAMKAPPPDERQSVDLAMHALYVHNGKFSETLFEIIRISSIFLRKWL
jgi:hypothetical protein